MSTSVLVVHNRWFSLNDIILFIVFESYGTVQPFCRNSLSQQPIRCNLKFASFSSTFHQDFFQLINFFGPYQMYKLVQLDWKCLLQFIPTLLISIDLILPTTLSNQTNVFILYLPCWTYMKPITEKSRKPAFSYNHLINYV
jgi:hypothetical protein